MIFESYVNIPLEKIHLADDTFKISIDYYADDLLHSISQRGILQPIWLQEIAASQFRVINGFKRVAISQKLTITQIPALIVSRKIPALDLFKARICERTSHGPLNPIEISFILFKLQENFKILPQDIINHFFPIMNLGKNEKIIDFYYPLHDLEFEIQRAIIVGDLSLEIATSLCKTDAEERMAYFSFIQKLKLSKNNQREFWQLLQDIKRLKSFSMGQILNDKEIEKIINNEKFTFTQKTEKIKEILFAWRYPQFNSIKNKFETYLRAMKLPPTIRLLPSPFFADSEYHITLSFRNVEEYRNQVQLLQQLEKKGFIAKLTDLI